MSDHPLLDALPVIITGAARGMGRAYARDAARQGARLVLNDLDGPELDAVAAELRDAGADVVAAPGSVTDPGHITALLERCEKEFGPVRGLVNNAGIFHVTPVRAEEPAAIRRTVAVNYTGAMRVAQESFAVMAARGGGSIVNVASVVEMGMFGASTYGATKGAVSAATRSMAAAGHRHGVRVNAVSPRGSTRMIIANGREFDEANPAVPPELTGPIVSYLLSDLAADVTGQVIRLQVDKLAVLGDPTPTGPRRPVAYTPSEVDDVLRRIAADDRQPYGWNDPAVPR